MWVIIPLLYTQDLHISDELGGHRGVWRVDKVTKCLPEELSEPQPRLRGTAGQMALLTAGSTPSPRCFGRACLHSAATLSSVLPPGCLGNSPRARQPQAHREGLSASHLKKAIQRGMKLSVTAQKRALRAKQTGCYSWCVEKFSSSFPLQYA